MIRPLWAALLLGCVPKTPPQAQAKQWVELPVTYETMTLTDLARPLPPSPHPCQVGSRQDGPVLTELVACGDRGVSRVMVLPAEAPPPADMLAMAQGALARPGVTLETQDIAFPANERTMAGQRIFRNTGAELVFSALAVVHPEGPWPELLTCSAPKPVPGLEAWCAAAIQALMMPDDAGRMGVTGPPTPPSRLPPG